MKSILKIVCTSLLFAQAFLGYSQTPVDQTKNSDSDDEEPIFYTEAVKEWKKQLTEWKKPVPKSFELYEVKLPGETVKNIARLYKILPEDIYANNADAINGLTVGMILEIPRYDKIFTDEEDTKIIYVKEILVTDTDGKTFEKKIYVLKLGKNETLQSLSQEFEVSIEEIIKLNPKALKEGIKQGTELKIVTSKSGIPSFAKKSISTENNQLAKVDEPKKTILEPLDDMIPTDSITTTTETKIIQKPELKADEHWVEPKETLYSISKKYNISLDDINALNPEIATNGLKEYTIIKIKKETQIAENKVIIPNEKPIKDVKTPTTDEVLPNGTIMHEVVSGETLFGLARKYNTTVAKIIEINPNAKNGLKIGEKIIIESTNNQPQKDVLIEKKNEKFIEPVKNEQKEENKAQNPTEHLVTSGDTLLKIAERYKIKVEELLEDNSFLVDNDLLEGQKLKIRQHE